jgi:transcriptional regulator with XRE-family HTH domain
MLLSSLRRQGHLSREQLAQRSGISADLIQSLEQGRTCNPTVKTLLGLAGSLNVPVIELIDCIAADLETGGNK